MTLQTLIALPMVIPVVPQTSLARFGLDQARKDYADTVGWPELVGQVANVYQQLTPEERQAAVILAGNYGEAGALDLYGPAFQLPTPLSPHLTFWYWKPAHVDVQTVVSVGVPEVSMRGFFADVTRADTIQAVDGVHSEEVGRAILVCREPLVPFDEMWPLLRRMY